MTLSYSYINWAEYKGRFAIEVWPTGAGETQDGWDNDAWEESKIVLEPRPGVNMHTAFKDAMRGLRRISRDLGCTLCFVSAVDLTDPARLPGGSAA